MSDDYSEEEGAEASSGRNWVLILGILALLALLAGLLIYYYSKKDDDSNNAPKPKTCTSNTDCASGQLCGSDGTCCSSGSSNCSKLVQKCSDAASCPDGYTCSVSGSCILKGSCLGDPDCDRAQGLVCISGKCMNKSCLNSDDCTSVASGLSCFNNVCVKPCSSASECGGKKCATSGDMAGRCVQCINNSDCDEATEKCSSGSCVAKSELEYNLKMGTPSKIDNYQPLVCQSGVGDYVKTIDMRTDSSIGIIGLGVRCNKQENSSTVGGKQGMKGGTSGGSMHTVSCGGGFNKIDYKVRDASSNQYLKYMTPYCTDGVAPAPGCCGGSNVKSMPPVQCPYGQIIKGVRVGIGPTNDRNVMVTQLLVACGDADN